MPPVPAPTPLAILAIDDSPAHISFLRRVLDRHGLLYTLQRSQTSTRTKPVDRVNRVGLAVRIVGKQIIRRLRHGVDLRTCRLERLEKLFWCTIGEETFSLVVRLCKDHNIGCKDAEPSRSRGINVRRWQEGENIDIAARDISPLLVMEVRKVQLWPMMATPDPLDLSIDSRWREIGMVSKSQRYGVELF